MIGPSDLNRIPRWTPQRQSDELRRYARSELGGDLRVVHLPTPGAQPMRGMRLWLTEHNPFGRSASTPQASPLRPNLAAVHFQGETEPVSRASRTQGAKTLAVLATPAMEFSGRAQDDCPDQPCACEQ